MKFRRITICIICALMLGFFIDSLVIVYRYFDSHEGETAKDRTTSFIAESETTLNDGFTLKYPFVEIRGLFNNLIGKRQVDGICRLDNGHLVVAMPEVSGDQSLTAMKGLQDVCKEAGSDLMYVSLPYSMVDDDDLESDFAIHSYANKNSDAFLSRLSQEGIDCMDMLPAIRDEYEDPYDAFYKTDHHWRSTTGLYCAGVLAREINERYGLGLADDLLAKENFKIDVKPECWLGERGRKTGALYSGLDDYEFIKPTVPARFRLTIPSADFDERGDFSVFVRQKIYDQNLKGRLYGESFYYSFLFGNYDIVKIKNELEDNGKILLVKDSYALAVAPFLAMSANELVMWDVRYNYNSLKDYIAEENFDLVIVMYTRTMIDNMHNDRFVFDFS